jgi:hypothetical protein
VGADCVAEFIPIQAELFDSWEALVAEGHPHVWGSGSGSQIHCVALCHGTAPGSKPANALSTITECIAEHSVAVYAIGVRSYSLLDRVLVISAQSQSDDLAFVNPQPFAGQDTETLLWSTDCLVAAGRPGKPPVVGEVRVAIAAKDHTPEDDVVVIGELNIMRPQKNEIDRQTEIKLVA